MKPRPSFNWSVHLDGNEGAHDKGGSARKRLRARIDAIGLAKSEGSRVNINATLFDDADGAGG